jgi:hypothetical protein
MSKLHYVARERMDIPWGNIVFFFIRHTELNEYVSVPQSVSTHLPPLFFALTVIENARGDPVQSLQCRAVHFESLPGLKQQMQCSLHHARVEKKDARL